MINKYPYTDFHELNLDWVINKLKEMDMTLTKFIREYSTPTIVYNSSDMIDHSKIYIYKGNEPGYLENYWYYWNTNTNQWEAGGLFGSAVVDSELSPTSVNAVENRVIYKALKEWAKFGYNFRRRARDAVLSEEPHLLNGGCIIDNDNYLLAYVYTGSSNNDVLLKQYTQSTHEFTTLGTIEAGHCDSMTYDPDTDRLYITPSSHWISGSEVNWNVVLVYDLSTLTLLETWSVPPMGSSAFDRVTGKLYGFSKSYEIYEIDTLTGATTYLFQIDGSYAGSKQGLSAYNGFIYISTAFPDNIRVIDLNGNIISNIPIAYTYDNFYVGELQFADVLGEKLIIGSRAEPDEHNISLIQIFETNLVTNIEPTVYENVTPQITCYVDINSTAYNPDGRNNNRFKYLEEALLYAQECDTVDECTIYDGTYNARIQKSISLVNASDNTNVVIDNLFAKAGVVGITGIKLNTVTVARSALLRLMSTDTTNAEINNLGVVHTNSKVKSYTNVIPILDFLNSTLTKIPPTGWTVVTSAAQTRNGTTSVKLECTLNTSSALSGYIDLLSGLPKPIYNVYYQIPALYDGNTVMAKVRINTSGVLSVNTYNNTALGIDTYLSYPTNPIT